MNYSVNLLQKIFEKGCVFFFVFLGIGVLFLLWFLISSFFKLALSGRLILAGIFLILFLILAGWVYMKASGVKKNVDFQGRR